MATAAISVERAHGTNTGVRQVIDTATFEMKRQRKKVIVFCIAEAALFTVLVVIYESFITLPPDPRNFVPFFFSSISFYTYIMYIIAVFLGAPSIAPDFEKQTGHQLFPRISRGRLLAGRVIGLYILYAIFLGFYYLLIGIYTAVRYEGVVPIELLWSLGFALLYGLAILSWVVLLSALMKNTGGAFGLGIGSLLVIFSMAELLLPMFLTVEPVFLLTYYFKILSGIFNMPATRYVDSFNPFHPSSTIRTWLTPSIEGALVGMLVYIVACLGLAYLRFRKRQLIS
jgi:ABC-type transport system involved in multi-copper enzyme maturation permease subunit